MYYESEYTDEINLALELIQEEGCEQALVEIGRVLSMGKGKYKPQKWREQSYEFQLEKGEGHLIRTGREDESGHLHLAHCISRFLFALQWELEEHL